MSFNLNPLFSDNMVLAKDRPVRVFGEGDCEVTASFLGETKTVKCEDGKFLCELSAPTEYGGPYELTVSAEGNTFAFKNVYVGEVVILGGQSNLQFKVYQSATEKKKVHPNDKLRFFMLERPEKADNEHKELKEDAEGEETETIFPEDGWVLHKRDNLGQWSLLGTRIAEFIVQRRGCVVGLIGCYQGASAVESWLPKELNNIPPYDNIPIESKRAYNHVKFPCCTWNGDGFLYDYMWSKLLPYSVNNMVWYQGEADSIGPEATLYDHEMKELINRYREDIKFPEMPFIVIQITDLDLRQDEDWKNLQAAQMRIPDLVDNCVCVTSSDVCEHDDVHPPTKIYLAMKVVDALGY